MAVRWKWKNGNENSDLFSSFLFPVQFHEHTNKYFFTEASYGTNLDIKRKMVLRSKSISLLRIYLFKKKRKKGEEEKEMKRRKKNNSNRFAQGWKSSWIYELGGTTKFTAVKWKKKKTKRFEWQSRLFPEKKEQMEKEGNPWIILIDGLPPLGGTTFANRSFNFP